ncbi:MAG: NAD(P)/FAD-dependent oxidoreductase [Acidimicrobiales bacterium]|nr:NAD(P)/FAD-dependent oxidoreductase [Acidimicrobiales bacterium]
MTAPSPGRTARLAAHLPQPLRRVAARLPGALAPPVEPGTSTPRVAIIGTGFGGLGMAARLRQAGIDTFTIYEREQGVGGTWRDNTYPGAACDVPSHLYSLSFAPKADWSRKFPQQPEILGYLESLVDRFGLADHLRLGCAVEEATFDDDARCWRLRLQDGTEAEADVVVAATGQLNRPWIPAIDGRDDFTGTTFHSARWPADLDLTGRDVAVVGIGASAIQFVPEVAKQAKSLALYQRSSNYVAPKPDGPISDLARRRFERSPFLLRLYRLSIWARFESRWLLLRKGSKAGDIGRKKFEEGLRLLVSEDLPEPAVIPDYPLGCKRILISNDWYPTLMAPHVRVVTEGVERVTPGGIVAGGEERAADTIIFGTGFASTGFLMPMRVTGRNGADLHERWAAGAEAHLGMTVSGFPNLFVLYGPNTNLGHNSIIFMLERQIAYVLTCVRRLTESGDATLEVKPEAEAASNKSLVKRLDNTVWAASCHSWYKTDSGKITNNWPGPTVQYWAATAWPRAKDFVETAKPSR